MKLKITPILRSCCEEDRPVTVLGPWLGEFGWELVYWQGFVRKYRLTHPEEYLVVIGRVGNSRLYELADEYWEIHIEDLESDMYLPRGSLDRKGLYQLVRILKEQELLGDYLGVPDRLHERGWLEFGNPQFNQIFCRLKPTSSMSRFVRDKISGHRTALLFPRLRRIAPEKNWTPEKWSELAVLLRERGFLVVVGGGIGSEPELQAPVVKCWDFSVSSTCWMDFQLALVEISSLIISGESGTGFLPGLCEKPGIVFGDPREKKRYEETENIFQSRVKYITTRDPEPRQILSMVETI